MPTIGEYIFVQQHRLLLIIQHNIHMKHIFYCTNRIIHH